MFQLVARHCELIFCLFTSPKYHLGEDEKAIIQLVARNCTLISCLLISSKCDLVRSKNRCFKGSHCTFNSFSVSCPTQNAKKRCFKRSPGTANIFSDIWSAQNATCMNLIKGYFKGSHGTSNQFSAPGPAQIRLGWVRESDVSNGRQALQSHFLPFDQSKLQLRWGEKALFEGLAWHLELNFGLLPVRNATWMRSIKGYFKRSTGNANSFSASSQSQNATWANIKNAMFQEVEWLFVPFFVCLPFQNATCLKSIKLFFKWSNGTLKAFSATCQAQNATLLRSRKRFRVLSWPFEIIFVLLTSPI